MAVVWAVLVFVLLPTIGLADRGGLSGTVAIAAFIAVAAEASWTVIGLSVALLAAAFTGLTLIALKEPEAVSRPKRESFVRVVEAFRLIAASLAAIPVLGAVAVMWRLVQPSLGLGETPEGVILSIDAHRTQEAVEGMAAALFKGTVGVLILVSSAVIGDSLVKSEESDRRVLETERQRLSKQIRQRSAQLAHFEEHRGRKPDAAVTFGPRMVSLVLLLHLVGSAVAVALAAFLAVALTLAEGNIDALGDRTGTYVKFVLTAFAAFSVCWLLPAYVVRSAYWFEPPRVKTSKASETAKASRGKRIRWSFVGSIVVSSPLFAMGLLLWANWIRTAGDGWWIIVLLTLGSAFPVLFLAWETKYSSAALIRESAVMSLRTALRADEARLRQLEAEHEAHESERLSELKTELSHRAGFLFVE